MTAPSGSEPWLGGGRLLIAGTVVLAVAAAAVLAVGSDDTRVLRLGILAALWAALLGTFAAARMRVHGGVDTVRLEELRTTYRLELEREIAARREHELRVEREVRRQAEQEKEAELAALRREIAALRENLSALLDGNLLVERVALHAESTRLLPRSVAPDSRDAARGAPEALSASASPARGARRRGHWERSIPVTDAPISGAPDAGALDAGAETNGANGVSHPWQPAVAWSEGIPAAASPPPAPGRAGRHNRGGAVPGPAHGPGNGTGHGTVNRTGNGTGNGAGTGNGTGFPHGPPHSSRDSRNGAPAATNGVPHGNGSGALNGFPHPEPGGGANAAANGTQTGSGGRRRRADDAAPRGAHSGGHSVNELLAAHGTMPRPRHRRSAD